MTQFPCLNTKEAVACNTRELTHATSMPDNKEAVVCKKRELTTQLLCPIQRQKINMKLTEHFKLKPLDFIVFISISSTCWGKLFSFLFLIGRLGPLIPDSWFLSPL